jgi:AraC-like DNA-binding protein
LFDAANRSGPSDEESRNGMREGNVDRRIRGSGRLPMAGGSVSRLAYARAKAAGVDLGPLLKRSGLTRREIESPRVRLEVTDQLAFLNLVAEALGDDLLGLHLAQVPDLREIGLFYYVIASSDVVIEGLRRGARYCAIVNEGFAARCIDGPCVGLSLQYAGVSRHLDHHQIEFGMVSIVRMFRQLTGLPLLPSRVRLIHRRQRVDPEFAQFFGDDIEFGASADEIVFPKDVRAAPIVSADPHLNTLLVSFCERALAHRNRDRGSFRTQVENAIVPLLPHGKARAGEIAHRLGVSPRTFARRLTPEGLTFSGILEGLRADLAKRYLADRGLSISEIAWLLGYQEVGAFSHAFKRWTGKSPREQRALEAASAIRA